MPIGALSKATRKCSSLAREPRGRLGLLGDVHRGAPQVADRAVRCPAYVGPGAHVAHRTVPVHHPVVRLLGSAGGDRPVVQAVDPRRGRRGAGRRGSRPATAAQAGSTPISSNIRSDQVSRSAATSHSQVAVRVSSRAAARLARLSATVACSCSRSVTSMVAPTTLTTAPCVVALDVGPGLQVPHRAVRVPDPVHVAVPGAEARLPQRDGRRPVVGVDHREVLVVAGGWPAGSSPTRRNIASDHTC